MSRRALAGAAVSGVLVLSMTGCMGKSGTNAGGLHSSASGTAPAGESLKAAAQVDQVVQQTSKVDTFKVTMAMDMPGLGHTHATGRMRLHPSLAMAVNTDAMSFGPQGDLGAMSEVVVDGALYIKAPMLAKRAGRPWVKVPLTDLGGLDQLMKQAEQSNPAEQAKKLLASTNIHRLGTEVIGGVQTVHYGGSVTLDEALANVAPQLRAALRQAQQALGITSTDYDLWVGPDMLPRQIVSKAQTNRGPQTATITYSDYGAPVDITAPPASEVAPMPSFLPTAPPAPTGA